MIDQATLDALKSSLRGQLVVPSDSDYDNIRQLYNAMIDKRPAYIILCSNVADVLTAVKFGQEHNLLTAVRSGGHNGPGLGSCDDGLVIDLRNLKGIRVNTKENTVSVEPGCTQGDVDHATHPFGLAVPAGIVSTTGIAGLTLGGGHGYLSRQFGLTIDNLLEVDIVLADGRFITANKDNHPDLFWAVRGGGGNFGIVTNFVFKAQPVQMIYGGPIFWDIKDTHTVLKWYREKIKSMPRALCAFFGLKAVPATLPFPKNIWKQKVCALISSFNGSEAEGAKLFDEYLKELPEPIFRFTGYMPFPNIQSLFDPLLPKGLLWYWKGDFIKEISDEAIDLHIAHTLKAEGELSLTHFYPIDGAVHDVKATDTAWGHREATWSMVIAAIDKSKDKAADLKKWASEYWQAVHPYNLEGAYINFMMEEGEERIKATYGDNHKKLKEIKKKYDPTNFFRVNQNILPD